MRRSFVVLGTVMVIALLGGAAFVAGRLLVGQNPVADAMGGGGAPMMAGPGGRSTSIRLEVVPSKDLPAMPPEVAGSFVRREDNSIFVGTGNMQVSVMEGPGGKPEVKTSYDGPVVEVVVTGETTIYQDVTRMPSLGEGKAEPVQQVVKPGSLEGLAETSQVSAWGERRGDRLIARTLLISNMSDVVRMNPR